MKIYWARALFLLLVVAGGAWFLLDQKKKKDIQSTSSCANHIIQHKMAVSIFSSEATNFPSGTNARDALSRINQGQSYPPGWLDSLGSACPESFKRDGSIGYLYVADGLDAKVAREKTALVLFCPAGSHQGYSEHCHALTADSGLNCLISNAAMIDLLATEIGRGQSNLVPYSAAALAIMEEQLAARLKYLKPGHSMPAQTPH